MKADDRSRERSQSMGVYGAEPWEAQAMQCTEAGYCWVCKAMAGAAIRWSLTTITARW
ncbi:MAG: hypothetical protein H6974_16385 [Gammaproteobacteria bacterium]|nr:hypothetical protein [Gammaproteobacteria bacterium]